MMKAAIVGCGTMGGIYARNLRLLDGVELVAACGRTPESARAFAGAHGIRAFASLEEMVREADPDVVCIALPNHLHKEFVLRTAALGRHVICEKPMALTPEDGEAMIAAAEAAGVRLIIGHVLHFLPEYRIIRELVAAGRIGRVGVAHAKRSGPHPGYPGSWFNDPQKSGGVIMDLMIHDIEFLRRLLGDPETVYAVNKEAGGIDFAAVTLQFRSGAIAHLESCWGYPTPFVQALELAGDRGVLAYDSLESRGFAVFRPPGREKAPERIVVPKQPTAFEPAYFELKHFLECIENNLEPAVTARDALEAVRIAAAARESARTGLPVRMGGGS